MVQKYIGVLTTCVNVKKKEHNLICTPCMLGRGDIGLNFSTFPQAF